MPMLSCDIAALRKNLCSIAEQVLADDEAVIITTRNGDLVLMS